MIEYHWTIDTVQKLYATVKDKKKTHPRLPVDDRLPIDKQPPAVVFFKMPGYQPTLVANVHPDEIKDTESKDLYVNGECTNTKYTKRERLWIDTMLMTYCVYSTEEDSGRRESVKTATHLRVRIDEKKKTVHCDFVVRK
jgi:hypothetical protein